MSETVPALPPFRPRTGRHPQPSGGAGTQRRTLGPTVAGSAAATFTRSSPQSDPETPRADQSSQMALAAMLTVRASSAALKMNERMPWAATVRRIGLHETPTSDTCDVMPITNEK